MPDNALAIVILHYGKPELTARLVRQLEADVQAMPGADIPLWVLDNAAPQPYPGAWLRLDENLYWAGAFEWTMQRLSQEGFQRVWFLNNDLYFVSKPPVVAAALGRLARMEQTLGRVGIYAPSVTASPYHPQMEQRPGAQFRRVNLLDGIAPLVHLEAWRAAGGLDFGENRFGYGVDLDFSARVAKAGWALAVDHQLCVRHIYHSTARTVDGFMDAAAHAEAAFLAERFGLDWRNVLETLKNDFTDYETF
ncbi:MAG: hypothetical protein KKE73_03295 [Proteobacteria bacterium]|nr:hypothetical protein [Pseudomonadota bacterium]